MRFLINLQAKLNLLIILLTLIDLSFGQISKYDGSLGSSEVEDCNVGNCDCPASGESICGTDDVTYKSFCSLNCAKRCNKELEVKMKGSCEGSEWRKERSFHSSHFALKSLSPHEESPKHLRRADLKDYTDFETLAKLYNYFHFHNSLGNQGRFSGHQTRIVKNPHCETWKLCTHCGRKWNPFCGSDGYTYDNKCQLYCARQKCSIGQRLKVYYEGICDRKYEKLHYPEPTASGHQVSSTTIMEDSTTESTPNDIDSTPEQTTRLVHHTKRPTTTTTDNTVDYMDTHANQIHLSSLDIPNERRIWMK